MRYSIMLQMVVGTTLILVGAGAFFGWLQTRPTQAPSSSTVGDQAIARGAHSRYSPSSGEA